MNRKYKLGGRNMLKKTLSVVLFAMAVVAVAAIGALAKGSAADFPPDPKGVKVIDRATFSVNINDGTRHFYAIIYNSSKKGVMKIFGLTEKDSIVSNWKDLYTWSPSLEGDYYKFSNNEVISISQDAPDSSEVVFWFTRYVGYVEGAVHFGLTHDLKTGKFEQQWSD
jgi:hypothetical protein